MTRKRIGLMEIGFAAVLVSFLVTQTGCRTPEQRRHVRAYGFFINARELPFALGDDVATVRKALKSTTGSYRFKPEILSPLPKWNGYQYMTTQFGWANNPKKQCGLFLYFLPDGRLVSIYAAHPLDITGSPAVDVNWIAGFRLPLLEGQDK